MTLTFNGCRLCQRRMLDAVASLAGHSISAPPPSTAHKRLINIVSRPAQRSFHNSTFWRQQEPPKPGIDQDTAINVEPDQSASEIIPPPTSQPSHVPWYLQVQPPTPISPAATSPINLAAQEIPPLPSDPPEILSPVLQHLSITIGLDHLTILDLRALNPPSALGSNLLMILGTARSEKHLNTSADRFCRWLRSTYKLRPFADGLLGRNELKLKLRRRNKKLKLAQSVGNTMYDKSYDDGITTGWVCCNLGDVSQAVLAQEEHDDVEEGVVASDAEASVEEETAQAESYPVYSEKDQERILEDEEDEYKNPSDQDFQYRGFGSASTAPRIVVQMFTEAKRLEMDLEGLWEARLNRREDKARKQDREMMFEDDETFETSRIEQELQAPEKSSYA